MTNYITAAGVQHFSITIASGNTTGTATITAVGSGAFILWDGVNPSVTNNPTEDYAYLTLTNSTTVTATRNTGTTGTVVIKGCVVDGDTTNLIASIQYGTVTIASSSSSGTASISAVTNNNAAVHLLGWSSANTTYSGLNENPVLSLSGTTVTATIKGSSGSGLTVGFVVIEFQGSALNQNVQNVSATSSSSVTSYTATITSVNRNNAITIYAGSQAGTATTNLSQLKQYGQLTASTTVTVNVATATTDAKVYNCSVVEFVSGLLNSNVQRGTKALFLSGSGTNTITSVVKGNSLLSWLGCTTSLTSANITSIELAAALTNNTTVTTTCSTTGALGTSSWEVAEFPTPGNVGTANGTSSVSGVGAAGAVGTINGTSSVAGASPAQNIAEADGTSSVSGVGQPLVATIAEADGTSSVSGVGAATTNSVGEADGTSSVFGQAGSIGTIPGTSTATAVGTAGTATVGSAAGTSTATATGTEGLSGAGSAAGTSTATAVGAPLGSSIGTSPGTVDVSGVGASTAVSVGVANGTSSALGIINYAKAAVGTANGTCIVNGESPHFFSLDILSFMTKAPANSLALMTDNPIQLLEVMSDTLPLLSFMTNVPVNSTAVMSNSPVSILGNF